MENERAPSPDSDDDEEEMETGSEGEDEQMEQELQPTAEELKAQGNECFKAGQYGKAIEFYGSCIAAPPMESTPLAPVYSNRAAAYMKREDYRAAVQDSLEAIKIDPKFTKAYMRAGQCYVQTGDLAEAERQLRKGAEQCGNADANLLEELRKVREAREYREKAGQLLEEGKFQSALSCLHKVEGMCSKCSITKVMILDCVIGLKNWDQAMKQASNFMREDPQNPDYMCCRGKAFYYQANTDQAIKHFKKALQSDPDHTRARSLLKHVKSFEEKKQAGNDEFKAQRFAEAVQKYTVALEFDPLNDALNKMLLCNRATAHSKMGQHQQAVNDCTAALKIDSKHVKALLRRAASYQELERFEEAINDHETALETDPGSRELKQGLKQAKLELKKSKRKNYYKILGVAKDCHDYDLKKAYKKAALKWHPDKNTGSEEEKEHAEKMFKEVGEAMAVLSDPQKREQYDAGADIEDINQGRCGHGGGMHHPPPEEMFNMFFGGGGGMPGGMGGMPGGANVRWG